MEITKKVTRGGGLLEGLLAKLRCMKANQLMRDSQRAGTLLDIGCGTYPFFLMNTKFSRKIGMDRVFSEETAQSCAEAGVTLVRYDVESHDPLPFDASSMDVVTLLAVFEHLDETEKVLVTSECRRVLRPGGYLILTTPAWWTALILAFLARMGFVSREELEEHRELSKPSDISRILAESGFEQNKIELGTFELGLNQWARASV